MGFQRGFSWGFHGISPSHVCFLSCPMKVGSQLQHSQLSLVGSFKHFLFSTSSTAQGGGGSFKNRKPIGRVGCCDSRTDGRANPLMDRKVVGVVLFGVVARVAAVTSLTTPGCSVVQRSSCSCSSSCSSSSSCCCCSYSGVDVVEVVEIVMSQLWLQLQSQCS